MSSSSAPLNQGSHGCAFNLLMLSWVSALCPPKARYQAILCSTGSHGYSAFRNVLSSSSDFPKSPFVLINIHHASATESTTTTPTPPEEVDEESITSPLPSRGSFIARRSLAVVPQTVVSILSEKRDGKGKAEGWKGTGGDTKARMYHVKVIGTLKSIPPNFLRDSVLLETVDFSLNEEFVVPSGCLSNCTGLRSFDLSMILGVVAETRHHCEIQKKYSRLCNTIKFPQDLLSGCTGLQGTLSLAPLTGRISRIPDNFLLNCTSLSYLDLSPLRTTVTSIGGSFLAGCSGLRTIDLSPLDGLVVDIGRSFMARCSGLHTIVALPPMHRITRISNSFLSGCCSLSSVDLSALCNITTIEGSFLFGCSGLLTIDLSPLGNVTSIGNEFMGKCTGLNSVDVSPLCGLAEAPCAFLTGCTGLTRLIGLPSLLSQSKAIQPSFLEGCSGLKSIEFVVDDYSGSDTAATPSLTAVSATTAVPQSSSSNVVPVSSLTATFLRGCTGLDSVDIYSLRHVTVLPREFLAGCTGLTSLDFSPMIHLHSVNGGFLMGCTGLRTINLEGLRHVSTITDRFLSGCVGLCTIDLSPLSNVILIDWGFMEGCTGITSLNFSPMQSVTSISFKFLEGCSGLEDVNFDGLSRLTTIFSDSFMRGCFSLKSIDVSPLVNLKLVKEMGCEGAANHVLSFNVKC